jgi:NAD(P)-dependent dehydrogenase (short-subunit alcohol dehydrogenase family)
VSRLNRMASQKTILVTGAAGGIGRAFVELALVDGARLILVDRDAAADLTDILDQRDRDYCIAVLRSRCVGGADVWGAGGR